jgi:hypothetical protein
MPPGMSVACRFLNLRWPYYGFERPLDSKQHSKPRALDESPELHTVASCIDAHVPDARSPRPSSPIQAFKLPMHSHSSFIDSTSCSYLGLLILLVSNNSVRADSRIRSLRSIPCAISTNMSKVDAIRARECSQSTIRAQQVLIEVNVR